MQVEDLSGAQDSRPATVPVLGLACMAALLAWRSADTVWLLLIASPLIEEVVFRWGVQDGLASFGASPLLALVGSGVVFAAVHGLSRSWLLAAGVLIPALALAALYRWTGRLLPCVAAHAAANAAWLALASKGLGEGVSA